MKHIINQKGITFIELLLVVSIILILSALSIPFSSRLLTRNAVDNTSDQLINSIRKAQIYAMMGKQNSSWGVNYSSNTITLYKGSSFATRDTSLDETFNVNTNISVSFSTPSTDINLTRVSGLPNIQPTITISEGNKSDIFSINSQGVVSKL